MQGGTIREIVATTLHVVLLPVMVARDARRAARFERLRAARHRGPVNVGGGVVRLGELILAADDIATLRLWTHEQHTMASGVESCVLAELVMRDGRVHVVDDETPLEAMLDALDLRGRTEHRDGGRSGGCAPLAVAVWLVLVFGAVVAIRALLGA